MGNFNFNNILSELRSGVESLAKTSLKDYANHAETDGKELVYSAKADLEQWAKELETGSITREDLFYLMQEDEALGKMTALKQAGLAQVHIDQFRNDVINMMVSTITGLIKI